MKKIIFLFLLSLNLFISCIAQSGNFTVGGSNNNYYPVTFYDGGWSQNFATELELGRSEVHTNSSWRGSLSSKFRYHTNGWGNGSDFIEANINQNRSGVASTIPDFIGGWKDVSTDNANNRIIIWLRGGGTTYFYNANAYVAPIVYDGVANAVPYQEAAWSPFYDVKTVADKFVNKQGLSVNSIYTPSILTEKVVVKKQVNWPDYVFSKNFKLRSVQSLRAYIEKYKHLPEIPSAKEVERDGLDLSITQNLLLKKIEEITLYMVDQSVEIKKLKRQITALKKVKK